MVRNLKTGWESFAVTWLGTSRAAAHGCATFKRFGTPFSRAVCAASIRIPGARKTTYVYKPSSAATFRWTRTRAAAESARVAIHWLRGSALIFGHRGNLRSRGRPAQRRSASLVSSLRIC